MAPTAGLLANPVESTKNERKRNGGRMFRFIGVIFGAGVAVTAGSYLVLPIMVIAVLFTIGDSISRWWPILLTLLGYALLIALVVGIVRSVGTKVLLLTVMAAPPVAYVVASQEITYTSVVVGAFVAATLFGVGLVSLAGSGLKARGLTRFGHPPKELQRTHSFLNSAGATGMIALVQNLWLAPTAVVFLTHPNVVAIIAALLGAIATFYVAEAV